MPQYYRYGYQRYPYEALWEGRPWPAAQPAASTHSLGDVTDPRFTVTPPTGGPFLPPHALSPLQYHHLIPHLSQLISQIAPCRSRSNYNYVTQLHLLDRNELTGSHQPLEIIVCQRYDGQQHNNQDGIEPGNLNPHQYIQGKNAKCHNSNRQP